MPTLIDQPWAVFGLTALVVAVARTFVRQGAEALKTRFTAMRHLRLTFDAGTPQFCWRAVLFGLARCAFTVYSELPRWRRHDDALPEFLPYTYGVVTLILFLLACMRWRGAASSGETVGNNLRVADVDCTLRLVKLNAIGGGLASFAGVLQLAWGRADGLIVAMTAVQTLALLGSLKDYYDAARIRGGATLAATAQPPLREQLLRFLKSEAPLPAGWRGWILLALVASVQYVVWILVAVVPYTLIASSVREAVWEAGLLSFYPPSSVLSMLIMTLGACCLLVWPRDHLSAYWKNGRARAFMNLVCSWDIVEIAVQPYLTSPPKYERIVAARLYDFPLCAVLMLFAGCTCLSDAAIRSLRVPMWLMGRVSCASSHGCAFWEAAITATALVLPFLLILYGLATRNAILQLITLQTGGRTHRVTDRASAHAHTHTRLLECLLSLSLPCLSLLIKMLSGFRPFSTPPMVPALQGHPHAAARR